MKRITVFDFDGTLTLKDSMMSIILFQRGWIGLAWALLCEIHLIVLMILRLYSNQKAKERLLTHCFGGMKEEDFDVFCEKFASSNKHVMIPEMMEKLRKAQQECDHVYVITASPERWVRLFLPDVTVLGTKLEVKDGKITGRLSSRNCYGQEKVNRLLSALPDIEQHRSDYHITAYGDSRGDKEMLAFADNGIKVKRGKGEEIKE